MPPESTDTLILLAVRTARVGEADAWLAALEAITRRVGATLWELVGAPPPGGPGPGHSHVVRIDSTESSAEFDDAVQSARRDGVLPPGHAEIRRDRWMRHGAAVVSPEPASVTAMITAEVLCTDPDRADEWDRWYDTWHLPDMMSSGAFVGATRWRRSPVRPTGTNDLTVYEIAGRSLDDAVAESGAIMPGLVAAGRKHECHCGGPTMALGRVSR